PHNTAPQSFPTRRSSDLEGRYDINIWYAFRDNTKTGIVTEEVHYCDEIPLQYMDQYALNNMNEVTAKVIKQPTCNECIVTEGEKERKSTRLNSSHVSISY